MINLKSQLNSSQLEAVEAIYGPVLVIAGAGSGKTRVIEYRVLNLVQNKINPSSILLLTFTREASRKMLERATRHDLRCRDVEGGTFHSFGYRILKKYGRLIGLDGSFSILDEVDSREAVSRCAQNLALFDKAESPPKKDTLRSILSASVNKNISIEKIIRREYPDFFVFISDIEKLKAAYALYKKENNLFDYDDLLVYSKLLLEDKNLREELSSKYKFIMVDEYQDTNKLQADIAYLLASSHNNIMAVGDDAQSIYGFRGASHDNIMQFPKKFSNCKVIKLEENYRSTQSILDLANSVLKNMENKYSKCLSSARKLSGDRPQILFFNDPYSEAEWIAEKIRESSEGGVAFSSQAVLFRSAYISIPLQGELNKKGIPYQVFGGLRFYETAHVKDLMAHLRIILNPKDEMSWSRVLMLIEGIGQKTSGKILNGIALFAKLGEIIDKGFEIYENKFKFSQKLKELRDVLRDASGKNINIAEQFGVILDYYRPLLKSKFDDWSLRLNDLEALKQVALRYDSLEEFLADFAIEAPEAEIVKPESSKREEDKPLTLSTIHSAKGLEWDDVFVIGLIDGVFPVSFALDDDVEIEEEHRLFYVAVTRAKNNLLLSLHQESNRGGLSQFNKISRFVDYPNVLSKLEKQAIFDPDIDEEEIYV